jgi:prophage DNA circulation protein
MSWRDQLRQASFRGVPFFVASEEHTGGRRTVEHEHPQADGITVEDLGRRHRGIQVTAYVLGADVVAATDALWEALHERGPGTLVLPLGPERLVQVARDGVRMRSSTADGGYTEFNLTFHEVEATEVRPVAVEDTAIAVSDAADAVDAAEDGAFEIVWDTTGTPGFVVDDLAGRLTGVVGELDSLFGQAGLLVSDLAGWRSLADSLVGDARRLIAQPGRLLARLRSLLSWPTSTASSSSATASVSHRTLIDLWSMTPVAWAPTAPATTATRRRQRELQQTLTDTFARVALVAAARAVPDMTWSSADEATVARDIIAGALDQAQLSAPDVLYPPLTLLRAAVIRDVTARAAALAPLSTARVAQTRPALAIAQDLYGDAPAAVPALADDIAARNRIRHPLFVPGGRDLEVLARA